jgi:hypothetical protein
VTLLLAVGAGSGLSAQGAVDVVGLIGKNRSEITAVFPGAGNIIKDWRGWESAWLVLGRKGQFVGLRLEPRSPMSEHEAEDAVRQLGVTVERAKYFAAPKEHGYSDMAGPVRTVMFGIRTNGTVGSIQLHSVLADTER